MHIKINFLVLEFLKYIPKGKVVSYKQVAEIFGIKNPRLVGQILHQNKDPQKYPCHRVIKSDGKIASGYVYGGEKEQRKKLEKEGVIFKNNLVNMESCCWRVNYIYKLYFKLKSKFPHIYIKRRR